MSHAIRSYLRRYDERSESYFALVLVLSFVAVFVIRDIFLTFSFFNKIFTSN